MNNKILTGLIIITLPCYLIGLVYGWIYSAFYYGYRSGFRRWKHFIEEL